MRYRTYCNIFVFKQVFLESKGISHNNLLENRFLARLSGNTIIMRYRTYCNIFVFKQVFLVVGSLLLRLGEVLIAIIISEIKVRFSKIKSIISIQ